MNTNRMWNRRRSFSLSRSRSLIISASSHNTTTKVVLMPQPGIPPDRPLAASKAAPTPQPDIPPGRFPVTIIQENVTLLKHSQTQLPVVPSTYHGTWMMMAVVMMTVTPQGCWSMVWSYAKTIEYAVTTVIEINTYVRHTECRNDHEYQGVLMICPQLRFRVVSGCRTEVSTERRGVLPHKGLWWHLESFLPLQFMTESDQTSPFWKFMATRKENNDCDIFYLGP